jgi:hypothetical protein
MDSILIFQNKTNILKVYLVFFFVLLRGRGGGGSWWREESRVEKKI